MTHLCPLCRKAEAIARVEYPRADSRSGVTVVVTLPARTCGRCGDSCAEKALHAAVMHQGALQKAGGK